MKRCNLTGHMSELIWKCKVLNNNVEFNVLISVSIKQKMNQLDHCVKYGVLYVYSKQKIMSCRLSTRL
jgi:hypothetical protein